MQVQEPGDRDQLRFALTGEGGLNDGTAFPFVMLGLGMVFTVPSLWKLIAGSKLPAEVHVPSIFLSLFVSVGVGVLFGWYPAQRAAKLDPIEALRHD